MTDRADELARQLVRVLRDGDDNPGIDIGGTWFECATDEPADVRVIANDIVVKLVATLRGYAEEARWEEREACAKLVEDHGHSNGRIRASHKHLAAALRARGGQG